MRVDQLLATAVVVPSKTADAALVRQTRDGDPAAFEELLDAYEKPLFNVAFRLTGDREDARDVVQGVFLKAYENLHRYDPKYRFFSWIYRIAINDALNLLKVRRRWTTLARQPTANGRPDGNLHRSDTERIVQRALMRLSPEHRSVVVLRHYADLAYREIASTLELPEKTVKSRLHGARRQLRDLLRNEGLLR